jgi:hypothetical protein
LNRCENFTPSFFVVSVAQQVRALDCGSRGWGFETPHSPIPSSSFSMD